MAYGLATVFGGTGFLGRRIVERLRTAGTRVRVAVRHTTEGAPQGGDIEVVYAVGLYVEQGEATFQAVHVDGAQEVAREAREAGIPRLVHLSGIGADVSSESSYVRSRALGELAVREARTKATIPSPERSLRSRRRSLPVPCGDHSDLTRLPPFW